MNHKPPPPPPQFITERFEFLNWRILALIMGISVTLIVIIVAFMPDRKVYDCRIEVQYVDGAVDTFALQVIGDPASCIYIDEGDVVYWKAQHAESFWQKSGRRRTLTSYAKSFKILP
jgi:hypothetical protein